MGRPGDAILCPRTLPQGRHLKDTRPCLGGAGLLLILLLTCQTCLGGTDSWARLWSSTALLPLLEPSSWLLATSKRHSLASLYLSDFTGFFKFYFGMSVEQNPAPATFLEVAR